MKVRCGMAATLLLAFSLGLPEAATTKGIKGGVPFDYVPNSSLIVVPVMINKHGPYKLLLDTGTTRTILSGGTFSRARAQAGPLPMDSPKAQIGVVELRERRSWYASDAA